MSFIAMEFTREDGVKEIFVSSRRKHIMKDTAEGTEFILGKYVSHRVVHFDELRNLPSGKLDHLASALSSIQEGSVQAHWIGEV